MKVNMKIVTNYRITMIIYIYIYILPLSQIGNRVPQDPRSGAVVGISWFTATYQPFTIYLSQIGTASMKKVGLLFARSPNSLYTLSEHSF